MQLCVKALVLPSIVPHEKVCLHSQVQSINPPVFFNSAAQLYPILPFLVVHKGPDVCVGTDTWHLSRWGSTGAWCDYLVCFHSVCTELPPRTLQETSQYVPGCCLPRTRLLRCSELHRGDTGSVTLCLLTEIRNYCSTHPAITEKKQTLRNKSNVGAPKMGTEQSLNKTLPAQSL